jgi:5-methylcytosine-specific restriction protein B
MNSVDRAAIPLDSALARRFDRIELRPNLELLAAHLGVDGITERGREVRVTSDVAWLAMTPQETAILLLDRLNQIIAVDLGEDFELGHGLLWPLGSIDGAHAWDVLAQLWDEALFPQLQERFLGRSGELAEALKVDNPPPEQQFAYVRRSLIGQESPDEDSPAAQIRISGLSAEVARTTLRWLAK